MCKIILSEKTNVCKYEVFDRNKKPVNETTAVYNKSKEGLVEIKGDIKMGNIYYLKTNETEKMLYLTAVTNETNTWNHTESITIQNGEQKERKITITIEDQKFFDFFLVSERRVGDLRCNGGSSCKLEKDKLKILNYSISEINKTLWLHVNADFDYYKEYRFSMGMQRKKLILNSTLILRFNVTNTWNHTESITIKNGEQKERTITIKIEDQKFFDFFLVSKQGVGDLRCNGGSNCKFEKVNLKILNYSISQNNKTLWLHVNADFDYNKEYRFSMGMQKSQFNLNSTLILRFNVTKIQKESVKEGAEINYQTSLALGIASAFFLLIVGLIIIIKRRKSEKNDSSNSEIIPLDPPEAPPDHSFVEICNRKFPKSTVKEWIDIKRGDQLGSGHFGNVYKGFLHLSEYQR